MGTLAIVRQATTIEISGVDKKFPGFSKISDFNINLDPFTVNRWKNLNAYIEDIVLVTVSSSAWYRIHTWFMIT